MDDGGAKCFQTLGRCQHNTGIVDGIPEIKLTGWFHKGANDTKSMRCGKLAIGFRTAFRLIWPGT